MTNRIVQSIVALGVVLVLAGCGDDKGALKVGGKDFGESKVLSEMIAVLAEREGIPVQRLIGLGPTRLNLEALKRGDIDIYVDYNGTGLVMLGQPALSDGDAAIETVRELYEPLGLSWGRRLGFANNYGIVMRADRAQELQVSNLSDLVEKGEQLSIGIDENFQSRPLDGFQPMIRRYGLSFGDVEVVPPDERPALYDYLLTGRVDLIEGFTTDGQIADYDLIVLEDDLDFFPVYEAAPLLRTDALKRYPQLSALLDSLAGKLDEQIMRDLNRRVDLQSQSPDEVARAALADIGLLEDAGSESAARPLHLAASPYLNQGADAGVALRAVRRAFSGRHVQLTPNHNPLAGVARGDARLALAGAQEFTRAGSGEAAGNFEAVGLVGETTLHIVALTENVARLEDAGSIAVGPAGSTSERTAAMIVDGLGIDIPLVNTPDEDARAVADAMHGSTADAAIVMAPLGNEIVARLLRGGARLMTLDNWDQGNSRIRYPTLRPTRIPVGTYPDQATAVDTLSAQLVLAAVGAQEANAAGDRGPGASYSDTSQPLSDATVTSLNEALDNPLEIDPALRQSSVLTPRLPEPPALLNPDPDMSVLNFFIIALVVWLLWIYLRPERR